ncbi:MAG: TIGR02147 family protein [Bdellovibrionota bacterium]
MKSIYVCNNVSEILASAFDGRKNRNANYSLRAFARDLDVSPSRLSEVMGGSEGISENTALKIAEKLKLKPQEKIFFMDTILATAARNEEVRKLAKIRIEKARKNRLLLELQEDQFKAIADWYHAAILELTQVCGFQNDVDWISAELGITPLQTKDAIARLKKLGLIQTRADGSWEIHSDAYQTFSKSSLAVKRFHQQILEKSLNSIKHDPVADRECQAMILAVPRKDLPKFAHKMRDFLRESWEEIGDSPKDELYALSVQLIPIRPERTGTA